MLAVVILTLPSISAMVLAVFNIFDEADCVDILINAGTKSKIVEEVLKLSGFDGEDVVDEEDYIKN